MEPIELNGKLFCSNCGLAVGSGTPNTISNHEISPINEPSNTEISQPETEIQNPLMPENSTEEVIESSISPEPVTQIPAAESKVSEVTTSEPKENILMNILEKTPEENSDDIRVLNEEELKPIHHDDSILTDKIKNVEQLGTAGILLDILSDEAVEKSKTQEIGVMKAATDLIDKVDFKPKEEKKITGAVTHEPQNGKKLKVNILDNSIVNPVIHPEIEAAPKELDLPLPNNYQGNLTEEKNRNLEQLFGEENLQKDNNEEIKEQNNKKNDFEQEEPEIEKVADLDPLSQAEITEAIEEKPVESEIEITAQTNINQKSEHLKNYFSSIVSHNQKTKKKHKRNTKKQVLAIKKSIIYITILIILFISLAGASFYFFRKSPIQNTATKISVKDEAKKATLPKEIPPGYEKSITIYDDSNQTYTTEYIFASDNKRKLILKEEKNLSTKEQLTQFLSSQNVKYQTKIINEVEYTLLENGSIAWTKEEKFFTITAIGSTYNDLVEKMATSME